MTTQIKEWEKIFPDEFFSPTFMCRGEDDLDFKLSQTLSGSLWKTIPAGHKWVHYFPVYDAEFAEFRGKKIKVLEIGVYQGASLKLWRKFFGKQAQIVGIDINPGCAQFANPENDIFVEIGSQADKSFLRAVIQRYGPFDLIIDDGSHVVSHQQESFVQLFIDGLADGGKYWIEDLEGNYWDNGLIDREKTTVEMLKYLIDLQNYIYIGSQYDKFDLDSDTRQDEFMVPKIAAFLDRISFYKGVAVVSKRLQEPSLAIHL